MTRSESSAAGLIVDLILLTLIVTAVAAYLLFKIIETIVRAFYLYPHTRALRVALVNTILFLLLTAVTMHAVFAILSAISFLFLFIISRCVHLYHSVLMQPEVNKSYLLDSALHRPWFDAKEYQRAA